MMPLFQSVFAIRLVCDDSAADAAPRSHGAIEADRRFERFRSRRQREGQLTVRMGCQGQIRLPRSARRESHFFADTAVPKGAASPHWPAADQPLTVEQFRGQKCERRFVRVAIAAPGDVFLGQSQGLIGPGGLGIVIGRQLDAAAPAAALRFLLALIRAAVMVAPLVS